MKKIFLIILVFLPLNSFCIEAKKISETEMKSLIRQIVNIQISAYNFRQANKIETLAPHIYDHYDLERLKQLLSSSIELKDVIKFNEFKKGKTIFKVFKAFYFEMRTWFIAAVGYDGSYYLLRNFESNHFNKLIVQKIGKPNNLTEYLNIANLYINTVEYSKKGNRKIIENSNYQNLKKKFKNILLPKLYKDKGEDVLEFYSYQADVKEIKFQKIVFSGGIIKNVKETLDD